MELLVGTRVVLVGMLLVGMVRREERRGTRRWKGLIQEGVGLGKRELVRKGGQDEQRGREGFGLFISIFTVVVSYFPLFLYSCTLLFWYSLCYISNEFQVAATM